VIIPLPVPPASGLTVIQGAPDFAAQLHVSGAVIEMPPDSSVEEIERLAGDIAYVQATFGTACGFTAGTEGLGGSGANSGTTAFGAISSWPCAEAGSVKIDREAIAQSSTRKVHDGTLGPFI